MESVQLKNIRLLNAFDFNFTVGNTYTFSKENDVWFVLDDKKIRHEWSDLWFVDAYFKPL